MEGQMQIIITRMLQRPTDDKFLSVMIQIPLMKGGWIHGIEQLGQFRELEFDQGGHVDEKSARRTMPGTKDE
jgi:hypothetical protein